MNVRLRDMPRFIREHRWTQSHMSEYIDGELAARQNARVEEHVKLCPKCHELLDGLKRTVAALGQLGAAPSGDVADGVIARLRSER